MSADPTVTDPTTFDANIAQSVLEDLTKVLAKLHHLSDHRVDAGLKSFDVEIAEIDHQRGMLHLAMVEQGLPVVSLKPDFETLDKLLEAGLHDLAILAGDVVGPSDVSWQDVAGTAAANLRVLADLLSEAREGAAGPFPVFPSPAEIVGRLS